MSAGRLLCVLLPPLTTVIADMGRLEARRHVSNDAQQLTKIGAREVTEGRTESAKQSPSTEGPTYLCVGFLSRSGGYGCFDHATAYLIDAVVQSSSGRRHVVRC